MHKLRWLKIVWHWLWGSSISYYNNNYYDFRISRTWLRLSLIWMGLYTFTYNSCVDSSRTVLEHNSSKAVLYIEPWSTDPSTHARASIMMYYVYHSCRGWVLFHNLNWHNQLVWSHHLSFSIPSSRCGLSLILCYSNVQWVNIQKFSITYTLAWRTPTIIMIVIIKYHRGHDYMS